MDTESESKLFSLISQQDSSSNTASEDLSLLIQTISLLISMDFNLQPKPETELMSLVTQAISVFKSMDLDSLPEPLPEVISLITQKLYGVNSVDSVFEPKQDLELVPLIEYIIISFDEKVELISIINRIFSVVSFKFLYEPEPEPESDSDISADYLKFFSLIHETQTLGNAELDPESKLLSLISQLTSLDRNFTGWNSWKSKSMSLVIQIISLVSSVDLNSQPKPESELISLITQSVSIFNSTDLDSLPEPLSKFIALIGQQFPLLDSVDSDTKHKQESEFFSLFIEIRSLKPEPELISLVHQIYSHVISLNSATGKHLFLCPQVDVRLEGGKFHVTGEEERSNNTAWSCYPGFWSEIRLKEGEDSTRYFLCQSCYGTNHKFNKAPVEIKHPLHPKHSLQLVLLKKKKNTRKCYCCDEDLQVIFYYCRACDFAMNISCVEIPPLLAINSPKWHDHTLAHFPRQASFTCDLCALVGSSCPFYVCLPCDFVVHQSCLSLPRVLRISRHAHRLSFIPFFNKGEWSCGVCRRKIDNNYGGYSCIKKGCSYAAHSKCATQSNVWDGVDLDGVPEEIEEEVPESFVRILDGIIQHFSHQQHHLRLLHKNKDIEYDEKQCQACLTPIYFGNFYSCMTCDFILHEDCANLSRKIHHPIHPHMLDLALVGENDGVMKYDDKCRACPRSCIAGFFYECGKEGCSFKLHVQCATVTEPLVHESHVDPLFLTSKPGEWRSCGVCMFTREPETETFNCLECDFALCFGCATLPHQVRYKHDKHILSLCYGDKHYKHIRTPVLGEDTSSKTRYWCEACESQIEEYERFYKCDEYCCVTIHIECLLGEALYMKPGSSFLWGGRKIDILSNNQHMTRPICFYCKKHCRYSTVLKYYRFTFCSVFCIPWERW